MRFIVLLFIAVCLVSVAKVALLRWKGEPDQSSARASVWEADGRLRAYPTAQLTRWEGLVYSPYREDTVLDVGGQQPGSLMLCGASQRPFYVPLRHDLHYGEIVGDWLVQRADLQGTTEYELRFVAEIDGVSARGYRVKSEGRALSEQERSPIQLTGYFQGGQLICQYEEQIPGAPEESGSFRWTFSSAQDALHGEVRAPGGLIDSQGRRKAGSRGNIPASGRTAQSFVPAGWKLLDHVTGSLPGGTTEAGFLGLVIEEKGAQPLRWLILAHRDYARADYQTVLTTPHACRPHRGNGLGDPFQGLFLPQKTPSKGIFGLRHHASRDYEHAGLDLWFHYDTISKDWRLAEGRRYRFDLAEATLDPEWSSVVPGATLAAFDIEGIQFGSLPAERPLSGITSIR